jgi:hypothetical protein
MASAPTVLQFRSLIRNEVQRCLCCKRYDSTAKHQPGIALWPGKPKRCDLRNGSFATKMGARPMSAFLQIATELRTSREGRGRDEDFSSPPAQIPACAANAPGSFLGSDVVR